MAKDRAEFNSICENFIKNTMDFYDIPGIAVGVYAAPYIFTGVGGFRNYETKELLQDDTVFHCTSVSKLFTAAGIMKLVEAGELSLDDRLCDVIPWMSIVDKRWEDVTIGSMLAHTSGLTDVSDYRWHEHRCDENAMRDYALSDEVAGRKLLWEPTTATAELSAEGRNVADASTHFRYSSKAYNLLGLVIAEVSGVTFEEFMQREVFDPLGMGNTTFLTFDRIKEYMTKSDYHAGENGCSTDICGSFLQIVDRAGLTMPHSKGRDRTIRLEPVYPYTRQHAPSSTLTSTTEDLLKWAAALMGSAPLEEKSAEPRRVPLHEECVLHTDTVRDMWTPRVEVLDTGEQMGLGWFIRKQKHPTGTPGTGTDEMREYTLVGHEGSDDGFRTSFWMCPELGIATVLLCNLTDAPLKKLNKQLFERIIKI